MISLVLALALTSPQPLVRCITSCRERGTITECVYDAQASCHPSQSPCIDSADLICRPRVVNLGTWSPVLLTYSPAPYVSLSP